MGTQIDHTTGYEYNIEFATGMMFLDGNVLIAYGYQDNGTYGTPFDNLEEISWCILSGVSATTDISLSPGFCFFVIISCYYILKAMYCQHVFNIFVDKKMGLFPNKPIYYNTFNCVCQPLFLLPRA